MRVKVDFRQKEYLGIIGSTASKTKFKNLKPLKEILDDRPSLNESHFKLVEKLSKVYPYPASQFIFTMLPPYLRKKNRIKESFPVKHPTLKTKKKPVFIKADSFFDRYRLWKKDLQKALSQGSVVICLPQLEYLKKVSRFIQEDLSLPVVEFFSRQKEKDSFSGWLSSRQNSLILGTRSSLFYFPEDIALIVLEEESSPYYFQETKPFYHLREVAVFLAEVTGSRLILSGSYPSLYSYARIKNKKIQLIEPEKKQTKRKIEVISRENFAKNKYISPVLLELIRKTLSEKKRGAIIWNKKHFWRILACTNCKQALQCQNCSGFLQQKEKNKTELLCPYCQRKFSLPELCPACQKGYLKGKGLGIDKLKDILEKFFPELKPDNLRNSKSDAQIVFSTSKILSCLYEKSVIQKGFILDIDSYLSQLDFDITFNAYVYLKNLSLIFKENLYVFSSRPSYYLFQHLNKNWRAFYDEELSLRKELMLPPFSTIVKVILRSKNKEKALKNGKKLYNILEKAGFTVYGPMEETPHKLREKYRYSLTVKTKDKDNYIEAISGAIKSIKQKEIQTATIIR